MSNRRTKENLPAMDEIVAFVKDEQDNGLAPMQVQEDLYSHLRERLTPAIFTNALVVDLTDALYNAACTQIQEAAKKEETQPATTDQPALSPDERRILLENYSKPLVELLQQHKEENVSIKKLLASFMAYAIASFHPSGWMRYNRKEIFALAALLATPVAEQERITKTMHDQYGLQMRVVGSNNPIPCFQFTWFPKATEAEELIKLHSLNPLEIYIELLNILGGKQQDERK